MPDTPKDLMHLAFYKGPATDIAHKIAHTGVCWWTSSPYSHVELVIEGWCYTASARDGGVRRKEIDLDSGKWDLRPVYGNREEALAFFFKTEGLKYDWAGVSRYVLPWLPNLDNRWYCSEWTSAALGWPVIEINPGRAYDETFLRD